MPAIPCSWEGCDFKTGDFGEAVAAEQLKIHGYKHNRPDQPEKEIIIKVEKPVITAGCTAEKWTFFLSRWQTFKNINRVKEANRSALLIECCEDDLLLTLHRTYGENLRTKPESEVIAAIKKFAVRPEQEIVAIVHFLSMQQDREEPTPNFVARLKGQANTCDFFVDHKCECNKVNQVSYTDAMVRNVLAKNIVDKDIQIELLGVTNTKMSLEETITFIEAKEIAKASAIQLSDAHSVSAVRSTYKHNARKDFIPANQQSPSRHHGNPPQNATCGWCGQKGHGNIIYHNKRKEVCPAYGKLCKKCNKSNHFENVCRKDKMSKHAHTSALVTDHEEILYVTQDNEDSANCTKFGPCKHE